MQSIHRTLRSVRFSSKGKTLAVVAALFSISLLAAACGDNTATVVPPTVAATTAPAAATTVAATTAAMTTSAAATSAATTAAMTSAAATTATGTTAPTTTSDTTSGAVSATTAATSASAGGGSTTGQAKITPAQPTAQAGTKLAITGEGFPPNTWVTLQYGPGTTPRSVASLALTDSSGKFDTQLILINYGDGSKVEPGNNTLVGTTQDGSVKASTTFNITPAATTATPTS